MAQYQLLDVYQGEDRTLPLAARDSSNNPVNLTSKTVTWQVSFPPYAPWLQQALLTKTGTVTGAATGLYTVALAASDASCLTPGNYQYQAFTTDGSGNVGIVTTGPLRVRAGIWPSS